MSGGRRPIFSVVSVVCMFVGFMAAGFIDSLAGFWKRLSLSFSEEGTVVGGVSIGTRGVV